jgi:hypothetical protein
MVKEGSDQAPVEEEIDKVATAAELINSMDENELEALFGKEAAEEETPEGEFSDDDIKTAQEYVAAGRLMAQGFLSEMNEEK